MRAHILTCYCVLVAGVRSNGEIKLRAIDDFTRSGVNAHTDAAEKLRCDTLDAFFLVLKEMAQRTGDELALWKADIDSAYRRVPIRAEQHEFSAICFKRRGVNIIAVHRCLAFGAIGSVHGWDRVGSLLRALARKILRLPVQRYVDDFFSCDRVACTERGMQLFARCDYICPNALYKCLRCFWSG